MPQMLALGTVLKCSFGMTPSALVVEEPTVTGDVMPAANILDSEPFANIPPFGMCMSPSNPEVAAATAAAMGVLTPMPCVPVTAPWMPGIPTTLVRGAPACDSGSTCLCSWGGEITGVTADTVEVA